MDAPSRPATEFPDSGGRDIETYSQNRRRSTSNLLTPLRPPFRESGAVVDRRPGPAAANLPVSGLKLADGRSSAPEGTVKARAISPLVRGASAEDERPEGEKEAAKGRFHKMSPERGRRSFMVRTFERSVRPVKSGIDAVDAEPQPSPCPGTTWATMRFWWLRF